MIRTLVKVIFFCVNWNSKYFCVNSNSKGVR